jgi:hypothetical protein
MAKKDIIQKRTKPEKEYDIDDVGFVFHNYSSMSANEIATKRGLARFQVNQIVNGLRKAGAKVPKKSQKQIIAEFVSTLSPSQRIS